MTGCLAGIHFLLFLIVAIYHAFFNRVWKIEYYFAYDDKKIWIEPTTIKNTNGIPILHVKKIFETKRTCILYIHSPGFYFEIIPKRIFTASAEQENFKPFIEMIKAQIAMRTKEKKGSHI
jgi:hypothetical protein